MSTETFLPGEVEDLARERRLGPLEHVHRLRTVYFVLCLFGGVPVFLIGLGLTAAGTVHALTGGPAGWLLYSGVPLLVTGWLVFRTVLLRERIYVFREGLVWAKGRKRRAFRWEDVCRVSAQVLSYSTAGIPLGAELDFWLETRDGLRFHLSTRLRDARVLASTIAERIPELRS